MPLTPSERLARAVKTERLRRWRYRADFARACGLSDRTVFAIEAAEAKAYRADTLSAIETALRWAPGDATRVMEGGRPTRDPQLQHVISSWPRLAPQTRSIIVGFVDDALS